MKLPNLPRLTSDYGRRQKMFSIALGLAVGVAMCLLYLTSGGQGGLAAMKAEQFIYDRWLLRFFQTGVNKPGEGFLSEKVTETLAMVVVDDASLDRGLPWPLPRDRYLEIVQRLEKAGAKTIALDILFGGPGPDTPEGAKTLSPKDEKLRQALARPSVIVPFTLHAKGSEMVAAGVYPKLLDGWNDEDFQRRFGFTKELTDKDKKVRRAVLQVDSLGERKPGSVPHYAFDVVALAHFRGITPQEVLEQTPDLVTAELQLSGSEDVFSQIFGIISYFAADLLTIETTQEDMNLAPGLQVVQESDGVVEEEQRVHPLSEHILVYSLADLLETPEDQLPGFFFNEEDPVTGLRTPKDALVLVGVTVSGGHDQKTSPIGPISGAGIHANVLANLIQGNFQKDVGIGTEIALMLAMALLAGLLAALLEVRFATAALGLTLVGYFSLGYQIYTRSYTQGSFLLPTAAPLAVALASFGLVTVFNVQAQKVAKDKFAKILQEVAPIPDLESLLGKDGLKVGSEERILTILFSDIRGYTDLSESLDAVTVTEMLNTYHGAMGEIFDRYGGVVFDYQGDAQMVVFGLVPASQPNHAAAACKAGVGMVLRLARLREEWQAQGRPVFETGVGICTGPVAIGILGSAQRKQYAAIGDPTNTAARMQGKSKDLDSPVLITQSTFDAAGDQIIAAFIEAVRVKGKREPLAVYGVDIQGMQDKMGVHA